MIIAGTGHRPQFAEVGKLKAFSNEQSIAMTQTAKKHLQELGASYVISGGALGWDTALARAAYSLKIPYAVYVPCWGHGSMWTQEQQVTYRALLEYADKWHYVVEEPYASQHMITRDHAMVNDCDSLLALWSGMKKGGTFKTIQYAKQQGKNVVNVWSDYEATA